MKYNPNCPQRQMNGSKFFIFCFHILIPVLFFIKDNLFLNPKI